MGLPSPITCKAETVLAEIMQDKVVFARKLCIEENTWALYFSMVIISVWLLLSLFTRQINNIINRQRNMCAN